MLIDFTDKVVAVSGGGTGYGKTVALRLAGLNGIVHASDVQELSFSELTSRGVIVSKVDLLDRAAGRDWIEEIETIAGRPIDIFVNVVGGLAGQDPKPFDELTDPDWDAIMEINIGTAFNLCRAVVPGMKRAGRGTILTIGSPACVRASMSGLQAYTTSKHALLGLTRHLAHELGPFGIRVNCIGPGFMPTNAGNISQWKRMGNDGQKEYLKSISLRKLGDGSELADAVAFFSSDFASFITGQMLIVDGGAS